MLTIEEVRKALKDRNSKAVAAKTNLAYNTILRIKKGLDKEVAYRTVKTLSDYLTNG